MNDEQFKHLIAKLDEILQRLPAPQFADGIAPQPPRPWSPGQCYFCGGHHHGGMICPNLQTRTIVAQSMGH